jgi:four helix bundle protein
MHPTGCMAVARHFEELDCWKLANELKLEVYGVLERPCCKRDFLFSDQFRDAAASAPRNIAEGLADIPTRTSLVSWIARGSLNDCQNHLRDAREYINEAERVRLDTLTRRALDATADFSGTCVAASRGAARRSQHPRTLAPSDRHTLVPSDHCHLLRIFSCLLLSLHRFFAQFSHRHPIGDEIDHSADVLLSRLRPLGVVDHVEE